MEEFIQQNASAIFGLLGAFMGGLLSFVTSWAMKNREFSLRIWDRLLERRIHAHENLIAVAIEMRVMVPLGGVEKDGEVARAPQVLISKDEFERWFTRFTKLTQEGSTWLSTDAKREFNFTQDYLVTLHTNFSAAPSDKYLEIGRIIRQDFINLSSGLERVAFDYFEREISKKKLSSLSDWHKYPLEYTQNRLKSTELLSNWEAVQKIALAPR